MKYKLHGGPRDGLTMDVGDEVSAPLVITFEYPTGKEADPERPGEELMNVLVARYKFNESHEDDESHEDNAHYYLSFSDQISYELPWRFIT